MGKKIAVGCGIGFLVGVATLFFACNALLGEMQNGFDILAVLTEDEMAEIADQHEFLRNWNPPAGDASPDELFPQEIGEARLVSRDTRAAIPDFSVSLDGLHGVYTVGDADVEVFVYRATESEKDSVFSGVDSVVNLARGGVSDYTRLYFWLHYTSKCHGQNHLWYMKGWLFVFRTDAADERGEFVKEYLRSVSAESPAAIEE